MGMFDELRCYYPLPVPGANDLLYQTKDTPAQWVDRYEIRDDGTLWHEAYDIEDHSDKTAPAGSPESLIGCMTSVNKHWEFEADFTGEIRFYTSMRQEYDRAGHLVDWEAYRANWIEFSAYFVRGRLQHLEALHAPNAAPAQEH